MTPRIELGVKNLQSSAFPLGYVIMLRRVYQENLCMEIFVVNSTKLTRNRKNYFKYVLVLEQLQKGDEIFVLLVFVTFSCN